MKLSANRVERKTGGGAKEPSLLAGLLFDGFGHRMTPSHDRKNGKRYRYYVSRPLTTNSRAKAPACRRIPAGEIERLVTRRIRGFFADRAEAFEAINRNFRDAAEQERLVSRSTGLAEGWHDLVPAEVRAILLALFTRIEVHEERVNIGVHAARITDVLQSNPMDLPDANVEVGEADRLTLSVPARLQRAGLGTKMVIDGPMGRGRKGKAGPSLAKLIVKSHVFRDKLIKGEGASLSDIVVRQGVTRSYFTRLVRLIFLAPDITRAILEGRHPPTLTAAKLKEASRLPLGWRDQREVLGFN